MGIGSEYMRAEETAALFKISMMTFYRWLKAGKIPQPLRISGIVRWNRKEVAAWIKEKEAAECKP